MDSSRAAWCKPDGRQAWNQKSRFLTSPSLGSSRIEASQCINAERITARLSGSLRANGKHRATHRRNSPEKLNLYSFASVILMPGFDNLQNRCSDQSLPYQVGVRIARTIRQFHQ